MLFFVNILIWSILLGYGRFQRRAVPGQGGSRAVVLGEATENRFWSVLGIVEIGQN